MELQAMLIGAAVVVVSALVLYLISVFAMTEKTYEEVLEEQRKRHELTAPPAKSKNDKEKIKKRFRKGKGVKADESPKGTSVETSEPESEKMEKMVEYELEPEVIEPIEKVAVEPVKADIIKGKKKKEKSVKPILVNKDDVSKVAQVSEVKETFHAEKVVPRVKDELELKHEREKILKKAEEMEREQGKLKEKKKKELKKSEEIQHEEIMVKQEAPTLKAEGKKTKRAKLDEVDGARNVQLINALKMAPLSELEVQTLIEILLNKQGASPMEWTKKTKAGDPVAALKKAIGR